MAKGNGTAASVGAIPLPEKIYDTGLEGAVAMFNAMIERGLAEVFSPSLPASAVRAELVEAIGADGARGTARTGYRVAVSARNAIVNEAAPVFTQLSALIDGGMPPGTPGRVAFFPTDNTAPSEGDLLVSFANGVKVHGWPKLPNGWTAEYLAQLGARLNAATADVTSFDAQRSGRSRAAETTARLVADRRKRMRLLIIGWYGASNVALIDFGLKPRLPRVGRRRKSGPGAVAPGPPEVLAVQAPPPAAPALPTLEAMAPADQ